VLGNGLARFLEEGAAVTPPPLLGNANRCTQIAQPNGTVSYTFDNANRRTGVNLSGTGDWTYAFDSANRLTSVTNPNSEVTSFTLDNAGRTTRQDNGNTTYALNTFDSANVRHDVAQMIVVRTQSEATWRSTASTLRGSAARQRAVRSTRTTYPILAIGRPEPRGDGLAASIKAARGKSGRHG